GAGDPGRGTGRVGPRPGRPRGGGHARVAADAAALWAGPGLRPYRTEANAARADEAPGARAARLSEVARRKLGGTRRVEDHRRLPASAAHLPRARGVALAKRAALAGRRQ